MSGFRKSGHNYGINEIMMDCEFSHVTFVYRTEVYTSDTLYSAKFCQG